ncbi:MAG: apolipoprotein N-acyltransferase [Treponema sp.]|nr:apolipoprotein N-acyltransferase [Treponema sp.]
MQRIPPFALHGLLCALGAVLFASSHPNPVVHGGAGALGFVALVPVFALCASAPFRTVWLWGALYGALGYGLFCFWLSRFNPYTIYIVAVLYGLMISLVFVALHAVWVLGRRFRFAGMAIVWCAWEFLKTQGFAGFGYGVLGYTQWRFVPLIQCSALGGVWMVSAVCALCAASLCASSVRFWSARRKASSETASRCMQTKKPCKAVLCALLPFMCWLGLFVLALLYGTLVIVVQKRRPVQDFPVALVQGNSSPWKNGVDAYCKEFERLRSLTEQALLEQPQTELVVWPETAFVPPVVYNYYSRRDSARYQLVCSLLSYIDSRDVCFVIGNQHSVDSGGAFPDDYNATLVFDSARGNVIPPKPEVYRKIHLVPFTEHFPYKKQFPRIHEKLLLGDSHFWSAGNEYKVFSCRNMDFATPICFEDTFGSVCRRLAKNGARLFVNVSNDSWAGSDVCQIQHLAMATFRCAENRLPEVRSTASGVTCSIDRTGRVVEFAPSFEATVLCHTVSVPAERPCTLYTRFGDWFGCALLLASLLFFVCRAVSCVCSRCRHSRLNGV